MRIGIISDTHIPSVSPELPPQVAWAFEGVDLILHAGDIYVASCLDWLERIAPVVAVEDGVDAPLRVEVAAENRDDGPLGGDPRVSVKRVEELEGYTLGMVHDLTLPGMMAEIRPGAIAAELPRGESIPNALQKRFGTNVDIVVFGHTHEAVVEEHQGVLLVNPGSATLPRQLRQLGTVAILELSPRGREAWIVKLAELG